MEITMFVLTAAERDAVIALVEPQSGLGINPRPVDATDPGVGINLNESATAFEVGAAVPLATMFVTNKRIVDDPDYIANAPEIVAYLQDKPIVVLKTETVFKPID
ncbi:hypothetical protein [uncultured Roseibium sp.]|uniref:hypothetical protein n=1 Tax=uncultured Roseibium sp. TaxID=1936171 RepID=UPI0032172BD1